MFNDKYGLTQAVLDGRKTMTRRIVPKKLIPIVEAAGKSVFIFPIDRLPDDLDPDQFAELWQKKDERVVYLFSSADVREIKPSFDLTRFYPYKVGDVVAIAQSYHTLNKSGYVSPEWCEHTCEDSAGYENKMFARADLMPHQIQITDIRIERLQDITDEDCMKEGIYEHNAASDALGMDRYKFISYAYDATIGAHHKRWWFETPKKAFAALIDKVSGKGTWKNNPYVFVYSFKLIK